MFTKHHVFTNRLLVSLDEWQIAIDADQFPIRLNRLEGSLSSKAVIYAELSNGPTTFELEVSRPRAIVGSWHSNKVLGDWSWAVTLSDMNTDLSAVTVILASIPYAERCEGVFYSPSGEQTIVTQLDVLKSEFRQVVGFYLDSFGLAPDPAHPYPAPAGR